jgi:hypothetical protein
MNGRGPARDGRRCIRPSSVCRAHLPVLVVLLVAGLAVVPAYAAGPPGHSHHESSAVLLGVLLLAVAGVAVAACRRRGRRAAILSLGLLVGLFSVELAVHSVHHFWDPQGAASCPLFLASQHADGAGDSVPITWISTGTAQPSPTCDDERVLPLRGFCFHEGRAPPVLLSA